jgi:molybdopterin-guanine dinucleotide biosynthesis protein A
MTREWPPLSAAVLAGGKSSRMGADKALLPLVPGGPALIEIVLDRLRRLTDDVTIVANDSERFGRFGARLAPDLRSGAGALGGIHAAVSHARHEHCLVVACDMPFLSLPLLEALAREPRDYDALVPLLPGESRQSGKGKVFHTLHAIYGKGCTPAIELRLDQGRFQVIGFFDDVRVRPVEWDDIVRWDPDLRSFFNANTPEALVEAVRLGALGERPHGNWR